MNIMSTSMTMTMMIMMMITMMMMMMMLMIMPMTLEEDDIDGIEDEEEWIGRERRRIVRVRESDEKDYIKESAIR